MTEIVSIASCSSSIESMMALILIGCVAVFFLILGYVTRAYIFGVFSGFSFLFLGIYLVPCVEAISLVLMVFGGFVIFLFTASSGVFSRGDYG